MDCESNGKLRWFYTGNQVGSLNRTGCFNFIGGGKPGSGIAAGTLVQKFFQEDYNRAVWKGLDANLSQLLLDAAWPFIELQWIAEITLSPTVKFNVSNRNIYVQDEDGTPRFYEARVDKAPMINISAGEWLSKTFELGNLSIVLNNRDGFFNDYLPQGELYTQWIGAEVKVLVGFGEERSNYFEVFTGIIPHKKGMETTLETIIVNTYEKTEEDRIEIPSTTFDRTNYPFADTDKIGKVLPIIYGDWSTELISEFGDIPAICSNANDDPITFYVWNISEIALRSIGDVFLHRGNRTEDDQGPIQLRNDSILKEPDRGRFLVPYGEIVLSEEYALITNGKPGAGSGTRASGSKQDIDYVAIVVGIAGNNINITYSTGLGGSAGSEIVTVLGSIINVEIEDGVSTAQQIKTALDGSAEVQQLVTYSLKNIGIETQIAELATFLTGGVDGAGNTNEIFAESSSQDFIKLGVQIGDTVIKTGSVAPFPLVTAVTPGKIVASSGVFTQSDTYSVLTDKYVFKSGDQISVICQGKDVEVMSTTRLTDANLLDVNPLCLSIGLDNDFWLVDNDAQKIYNVSFNNTIIKEIDYADIDPLISEITGIDIQTDNTLWFFDRPLSKIYRYVVEDDVLGDSFSTIQVLGLAAPLAKGGPLSIDDGNVITLHDQVTGNFYRISPFANPAPTLLTTWNRNIFNPLALDVVDIAADINANQIVVMDRETGKIYRVDQETGVLVSSFDLVDDVASNFTQARGVGYYIDGTLFLLNKQDLSIYNYNEFTDASENPAFIARDLLQSYAGKTTADFDLKWNETARGSLGNMKARVSIDAETNTLDFLAEFLQSYNVNMHLGFQKYSLFHITFDNFSTNGLPIREGDIRLNSFKPKKEYNQYFNAAFSKYKTRPFTGATIQSDNYVSPSGVQLAGGKEIKKSLDLSPIYRREDLDVLMPLFVRLAAAEPEFIDLSVGFRFLFGQLNTFYNINFKDLFNKDEKSGRRFDNIPSFIRKFQINLDSMEIKLKLWSLGTTQFGDFTPVGVIGGGELDQIILTNLGTVGYVAPIGDITASTISTVDLLDRDGDTAEDRSKPIVGNAWRSNYKVGLYSGQDHNLVEELTISLVSGSTITFTTDPVTTIQNTVRNSAGFISDGHYLKYLEFNKVTQTQQDFHCFYGRPLEGYALTTTSEIEEQRSGAHSFDNGRLPYVLHPVDFIPS